MKILSSLYHRTPLWVFVLLIVLQIVAAAVLDHRDKARYRQEDCRDYQARGFPPCKD